MEIKRSLWGKRFNPVRPAATRYPQKNCRGLYRTSRIKKKKIRLTLCDTSRSLQMVTCVLFINFGSRSDPRWFSWHLAGFFPEQKVTNYFFCERRPWKWFFRATFLFLCPFSLVTHDWAQMRPPPGPCIVKRKVWILSGRKKTYPGFFASFSCRWAILILRKVRRTVFNNFASLEIVRHMFKIRLLPTSIHSNMRSKGQGATEDNLLKKRENH